MVDGCYGESSKRTRGGWSKIPKIGTVIYATYLEPHAPKVFRYAVGLAGQLRAKVVLLHAVEPLGSTARTLLRHVLPADQAEAIQKQGMEKVHEEFRRWLEQFRVDELESTLHDCGFVSEVRAVEGPRATVVLA